MEEGSKDILPKLELDAPDNGVFVEAELGCVIAKKLLRIRFLACFGGFAVEASKKLGTTEPE